jgi:BirA family biotin operon repressor/biotin-[acetyl-CoA-carboxylase] ligase
MALRSALADSFVVALDVVAETTSTNADLVAAARGGAAEATVLVADFQHAGRGRFARTWASPPRAGLTFSMLLRPTAVPVVRWGWLPLLTGVALHEAVRAVLPDEAIVALKWPNDLLLGPRGAKAAGILAEAGPDFVVVGIGLNVDHRADELPNEQATSLRLSFPSAPVTREVLLAQILESFGRWYARWLDAGGDPDASGLRAAYESASATLGRTVQVSLSGREITGPAVAIDANGALVVAEGTDRVIVSAGDVTHARLRDR